VATGREIRRLTGHEGAVLGVDFSTDGARLLSTGLDSTIRLWDPRELELPDAGLIVVEDAETGEQLTVDTGDLRFRQRFQEATRRHEAQLKDNLRKAGVDLFTLSTEEDLVSAIVHMASLRKKRDRLSAQERITAY